MLTLLHISSLSTNQPPYHPLTCSQIKTTPRSQLGKPDTKVSLPGAPAERFLEQLSTCKSSWAGVPSPHPSLHEGCVRHLPPLPGFPLSSLPLLCLWTFSQSKWRQWCQIMTRCFPQPSLEVAREFQSAWNSSNIFFLSKRDALIFLGHCVDT